MVLSAFTRVFVTAQRPLSFTLSPQSDLFFSFSQPFPLPSPSSPHPSLALPPLSPRLVAKKENKRKEEKKTFLKMSNKSPIFPMPDPQHFSDYGFDPQIDYFQVLICPQLYAFCFFLEFSYIPICLFSLFRCQKKQGSTKEKHHHQDPWTRYTLSYKSQSPKTKPGRRNPTTRQRRNVGGEMPSCSSNGNGSTTTATMLNTTILILILIMMCITRERELSGHPYQARFI